jgi:quercetin dioxygenase-like cupin family protein
MNKLVYFPKEKLKMKPDVAGAKMWAVGLEKAMLTYFQIEANSQFEMHSHESEQITMVLEGNLYFKSDEIEICVSAGEVIAVPSNVLHSVYTKDKPVKAVDAWSPVRKEYLNSGPTLRSDSALKRRRLRD